MEGRDRGPGSRACALEATVETMKTSALRAASAKSDLERRLLEAGGGRRNIGS